MSIYGTKTAEEMGKKAKEHRKKVEMRNQKLAGARKKFEKEMGEMFKQQMESQQMNVYASTGDFVAKNYDKIVEDGSIEYLKEHTDVAFS
jgi:predicted  nucleic acid-binding Zn-ribbon protein